MKNIKILLTNSFKRDPRVYKEAKALVEKGHNVEVVCWDREENATQKEIVSGIYVKRFYIPSQYGSGIKQIKGLIKYYWSSINYLRNKEIDIIYAQDFDTLLLGWIMKLLKNKVKLIYEVKDLYFRGLFLSDGILSGKAKKIGELVESFLLKYVDHLIIASKYFKDFYIKRFNPNKITTIWNVPEESMFCSYRNDSQKENYIIAFLGNVRYINEMKLLINSTKNIEDIEIFIAGGGSKINELEEYLIKNNFNHVNLYGKYDYSELPYLYSKADCIYSVYDKSIDNVKLAIPNKLFESIYCELPIIVSNDTALGSFVNENDIGYTISGESEKELKKLILKLRDDKNIKDKIKKNAKKIKDKYIWENLKKDLTNIFE